MKNGLKKVICLLLSLTLVVSSSSTVFAKNSKENQIELLQDFYVSTSDVVPMYAPNDELTAFYMNGIDDGYAIIGKDGSIIEFSYDESDKLDSDKKWYYLGPEELYFENEKNNEYIVNYNDYQILDKEFAENIYNEFITELTNNNVINNSKDHKKTATITYPDGIKDSEGNTSYSCDFSTLTLKEKNNLPYNTRYFSYNTTGTCGSTACAILFYYYYDHVSSSYIKNSEYTSSAEKFVKHFRNIMDDNGAGTSYTELKSGINEYLKEIGKSQSCSYVTTSNVLTAPITKIKNQIDNKRPCIVGLKNEPVYNNHWTVAEGYVRYLASTGRNTRTIFFVRVNNGWYSSKSKNLVYVNYDYVDGAMYF